jgi:dephospho-CoA kinase
MKVVGVTGGICGGKSTVCGFLREAGAAVIDCDAVGHEAYLPGTAAHAAIVREFAPLLSSSSARLVGAHCEINRRVLGELVFSDAAAMARLCAIVWPAISALVRQRVAALRSATTPPPVVFIEAALLLDAGWDAEFCDEVWVAYVARDVARARLMARNSLSAADADKRIDA